MLTRVTVLPQTPPPKPKPGQPSPQPQPQEKLVTEQVPVSSTSTVPSSGLYLQKTVKLIDVLVEKKKDPQTPQDWAVGYHPNIRTNLSVDLVHTLLHASVVCCIKFSDDGKFVATGCNKTAQIYEVETGKKVKYVCFC